MRYVGNVMCSDCSYVTFCYGDDNSNRYISDVYRHLGSGKNKKTQVILALGYFTVFF